MKIAALTISPFILTARRICGLGAEVTTVWESIQRIESIDLLMVFLHPGPDRRSWINNAGQTVVTSDQLASAKNLRGAVVFVGACYGLENDAMLDALAQAGARAIVAGGGLNTGGLNGYLAGADMMAGALRSALQIGSSIGAAWAIARAIVHVAKWRGVSGAEDALAYRLLKLEDGQKTKGQSKMAAIIAGVVGLILMLLSALAPGGDRPAVFFSILSPLPVPDRWGQEAWHNDVNIDPGAMIALTDTDHLSIDDRLGATGSDFPYTFTVAWDTSAISLTAYSIATGTIVIDSGIMTWTVESDPLFPNIQFTKTFSVVSGPWEFSHITESWEIPESIGYVDLIDLYHGDEPAPTRTPTVGPTPSPTNTPRPTHTSTPTPDATRYVITAIPFGTATPRPTVLCCQTTPGASVPYRDFLPIVVHDPFTPTPTATPAPP